MNKIRNALLLLLLLIISGQTLPAWDTLWGGRIDLAAEGPIIQGSLLNLNSLGGLTLWCESEIAEDFHLDISASMYCDRMDLYGMSYNSGALSYLDGKTSFYGDLAIFRFTGKRGPFRYTFGRHIFQDPGVLILSHSADGLTLETPLGQGQLIIQTGYTGFVNFEASNISMTVNDREEDIWGSPRLINRISYRLPPFQKQESTVTLLNQYEIRESKDLKESTSRLQSSYIELFIKGFISSTLLHKTTVVGEFGSYGNSSILAGAGISEISYLPADSTSIWGICGIWSTGDNWKKENTSQTEKSISLYTPISDNLTIGYAESFLLGNIAALSGYYSLKPQPWFSGEIRTTSFWLTRSGPVSSGLVTDNGSNKVFLGQELKVGMSFRPYSDIGFSWEAGVLSKGDALSLPEELDSRLPLLWKAGARLSVSF